MFSYCYLGCLVYIGWYILGGVQCGGVVVWCGGVGVWVVWGGVVYYSIAIIYYYIWYVVWGVCGVVCSLHLHQYVLVYSGGVWWCVCIVWYVCVYVIYIIYYIILLCVYCICIVSIMLVMGWSLFVSVLVTVQTQLRDRLYSPSVVYWLDTIQIQIKLKNQHKHNLNTRRL